MSNASTYIKNVMCKEIGYLLFTHYHQRDIIDDLDWDVFEVLTSIINGLEVTRVNHEIKDRLIRIMLESDMQNSLFFHEVDVNWIGEKQLTMLQEERALNLYSF